MRNPRIYTQQSLAVNQQLELTDSAANHVGRVLRMRPEELLILFNGEGKSYQGRIIDIGKKAVSVLLESEIESVTSSPLSLHLGQTLSRGERMDYAIQKATEMGVREITPLFSERCEVKLKTDRLEKRLKHWEQVAISACEQCRLNRVPVIHSPMSVEDWVKRQQSELKFVLHHRTEKKLEGFAKPQSVSLLIGPEGGLTADEITMAERQGFNPLTLGPRVLRTETAPIAGITLMQYLWGDI